MPSHWVPISRLVATDGLSCSGMVADTSSASPSQNRERRPVGARACAVTRLQSRPKAYDAEAPSRRSARIGVRTPRTYSSIRPAVCFEAE